MKARFVDIPDVPQPRVRHTRTQADRAALALQKVRETDAKRDANRLRLYRLLEQVAIMNRNGVTEVDASFVPQVDVNFLFDSVARPNTTGVRVTYIRRNQESRTGAMNTDTISDLHVDTEDWMFEDIQEQLLFAAQAHERFLAEQAAKDAAIRKLSPEDRKTLGFGNWKDPQKVK